MVSSQALLQVRPPETPPVSPLLKAQRALQLAEAKTGLQAKHLDLSYRYPARQELHANQLTVTPGELAAVVSPRLVPGTVAQIIGSRAALWAVAAAVQGPEDWLALAALPDAGLLAAQQAGLALNRSVVVPNLGTQFLSVLAGLIDAYGLVVAGSLPLNAGDRRRIEARLRFTGGRLITAGKWPGAAASVAIKQTQSGGLEQNQPYSGELHLACQVGFKGGLGSWG